MTRRIMFSLLPDPLQKMDKLQRIYIFIDKQYL